MAQYGMTVDGARAREIAGGEAARILGPVGMAFAMETWDRRRPRGFESLRSLLREIGQTMDDPRLAESYVQGTLQRILSIAGWKVTP